MRENARVGIVASSFTNALQAAMIFEKMKRVVEKFLHKPLYNYGFLPDDGEQGNAQKTGDALSAQSPSKAFTHVTDISRTLFEMDQGEVSVLDKDAIARGFAEKLFSPSPD